ncbi:hypothetical protein [Crenothrix sp.]|uniref:hypothetical protein n=1 Tax=Crenothrix sp. TaxID=3100433 RepID=UPI00374CCDDA
MNRSKTVDAPRYKNLAGYQQRVAHHEAGHATGIYLNNRDYNLPPVFFKIIFKNVNQLWDSNGLMSQDGSIAKIKGGRLVQSLMPTFKALDSKFKCADETKLQVIDEYRLAFEADIVNLLIGPLAEAKFSYQTDNELFNEKLITLRSLKNYGGDDDLALVKDYLQSYSTDQEPQYELLDQLFAKAFNFINDNSNWKAIMRLANHILSCNNDVISCEEVALVLTNNT